MHRRAIFSTLSLDVFTGDLLVCLLLHAHVQKIRSFL